MIKSSLGVVGLAAATVLAFSAPVKAEEFAYSFTIGATSDYVFRGLSLNEEEPTIQGSVDVTYGLFYAGVWGSQVEGDGFAPLEVDVYGGIKPVWGQFTFDFGVLGYLYPEASNALDYVEFKAGVSTEIFKNLSGTAVIYYVPDQDNSPEVITYEGTLSYALPQFWVFAPSVSGQLGYADSEDGFFFGDNTYTYWNAGLALVVEKITFDFRYWDTDLDNSIDNADERFVFTAKITLP